MAGFDIAKIDILFPNLLNAQLHIRFKAKDASITIKIPGKSPSSIHYVNKEEIIYKVATVVKSKYWPDKTVTFFAAMLKEPISKALDNYYGTKQTPDDPWGLGNQVNTKWDPGLLPTTGQAIKDVEKMYQELMGVSPSWIEKKYNNQTNVVTGSGLPPGDYVAVPKDKFVKELKFDKLIPQYQTSVTAYLYNGLIVSGSITEEALVTYTKEQVVDQLAHQLVGPIYDKIVDELKQKLFFAINSQPKPVYQGVLGYQAYENLLAEVKQNKQIQKAQQKSFGPDLALQLATIIPNIHAEVKCPCPAHNTTANYTATIFSLIQHLNDSPNKWTFDQIADWLESLDVDLQIKAPEETKELSVIQAAAHVAAYNQKQQEKVKKFKEVYGNVDQEDGSQYAIAKDGQITVEKLTVSQKYADHIQQMYDLKMQVIKNVTNSLEGMTEA